MPAVFARGTRCGLLCGVRLQRAGYCPAKAPENTGSAQDTEIRTYEEKIHHLADQMISIDLDDGVKKNYAIFQDVLAKIK